MIRAGAPPALFLSGRAALDRRPYRCRRGPLGAHRIAHCATDLPDSNIDVNVEGYARRRRRLALVRGPGPLHQARPGRVPRPGPSGRGGGRPADVGLRRPPHRPVQCRRRHRTRRHQGERVPGSHGVVARRGPPRRVRPRVRLGVLDECGIDAQIIFPSTIGLGGQDLGMVDDLALCRLAIEIYNDGMAEIQADSGNRLLPLPLMPAWDVDDLRQRGPARRRPRRARRQHDLGSPGSRCAGPGQPGLGSLLGGMLGAASPGALPHRCKQSPP